MITIVIFLGFFELATGKTTEFSMHTTSVCLIWSNKRNQSAALLAVTVALSMCASMIGVGAQAKGKQRSVQTDGDVEIVRHADGSIETRDLSSQVSPYSSAGTKSGARTPASRRYSDGVTTYRHPDGSVDVTEPDTFYRVSSPHSLAKSGKHSGKSSRNAPGSHKNTSRL